MRAPSPRSGLRAIWFDLDGTLIDHFATLYQCYRYALGKLNLPLPPPEVVRRNVGGSMEVTMRRFVDEAHVPEAAQLWRERLSQIYLDDVTLLPGARDLLRALHERGLRLGVLTNKIGAYSRGITRHLGLDPFLDAVLGANDTPYRKPQREFSALALARFQVTGDEACLVGDSPFDIEAARSVGMRCACVTTGTHSRAELLAAGADSVHESLAKLGEREFGITAAGTGVD